VTGAEFSAADQETVARQLGRTPRGVIGVAHRCPFGFPTVLSTSPRLADGTPFPTMFYLTCPRAVTGCSRLESSGLMLEFNQRLADDPELAAAYLAAHTDYLARRDALLDVPELSGISAGGMPDRVKCLHVHLGHTLAAGPGINPVGDEVVQVLGAWWSDGSCQAGCAGE
jgi:uncharacterized protein